MLSLIPIKRFSWLLLSKLTDCKIIDSNSSTTEKSQAIFIKDLNNKIKINANSVSYNDIH